MSHAASAWAWHQKCPDPGTKLVLIKLADIADQDGWCNPNHPTVIDQTGISLREVHHAICHLIEHGFLVSEKGSCRLACGSEPPFAKEDGYVRPTPDDWARLRLVVFKRDNFTCHYCGKTNGPLECDHRIPLSRGGLSTIENLVTACQRCNRSKKDKLLSEWRQ